MTRPNGNLWKMSAISEVNKFLSRKAWNPKKISAVKEKGRNPVPVKLAFKRAVPAPDEKNYLVAITITR